MDILAIVTITKTVYAWTNVALSVATIFTLLCIGRVGWSLAYRVMLDLIMLRKMRDEAELYIRRQEVDIAHIAMMNNRELLMLPNKVE